MPQLKHERGHRRLALLRGERSLEEVAAQRGRGRAPARGDDATGAKPGKVGRNDPCPCGSGKKYKKCHGA